MYFPTVWTEGLIVPLHNQSAAGTVLFTACKMSDS